MPQVKGGLGIIDLELQSQALLGKLVIHGLTPGGQTWKLLLQQGLNTCTPQRGGDSIPLPGGASRQPPNSASLLVSPQSPHCLKKVAAQSLTITS